MVARRRRRNQAFTLVGVFVASALGALTGSALGGVDSADAQVPVTRQQPGETSSPDRSALRSNPATGTPYPGDPIAPRATALDLAAAYDLDVMLDYDRGTAHVVERISAKSIRDAPIHELNLFVLPHLDADGFRELELRSVEVDGTAAGLEWTMDGANLVILLPESLRRAAATELVIDFDLAAGPAVEGAHQASVSKSGGVMQFLLWYPILSDGHGARQDGDTTSASPAGTVTYRIRSATPVEMAVPGEVLLRTPREVVGQLEHARDFAFAVSPDFRTWQGRSGSTDVLVYAHAGADGAAARDLAVQALDRYGRLLRQPYPAERFVVVGGSMDMESSGLVFLNADDLDDEYNVAHEVAHVWFHWLIGNDQLREPWLDEAFATYLGGGLEPRHADGFCSALPVNSTAYRFPNLPLETFWTDCDGYVQTVYYKGSWLLDHVRTEIGDAAFLASLREYVATYRFKVATTRDLVAIWRHHEPGLTDTDLAPWLDLDQLGSPTMAGDDAPA